MSHSDLALSGETNFSSLLPEEQIEQARRFPQHSAASFAGELTHAGYLDVDVTYVVCTEDKTLPPDFQRRTIQRMIDAGAKVDVVEFETDHCWPCSTPRSMAKRVVAIAEGH